MLGRIITATPEVLDREAKSRIRVTCAESVSSVSVCSTAFKV